MSDKISCVAVDDEPPALMVIEKYIGAVPSLQLVAQCNNALEALDVIQNNKVDLMFLDVQMPRILGTDFIRTLSNPPKVIFTTAFRKFAVEGFELDAVDYLIKPISFERFLKALNKVMSLNLQVDQARLARINLKSDHDPFIYLRSDRKNVKVDLNTILFIESLKDYIKVVTTHSVIVTRQSISSIEDSLPADSFVRIHRSFIVSLSKIKSYTSELIQIGDYELPISRSYRLIVTNMLKHKE
jgi:DNA-binding LytR/AlgR family response regulator